MSNTKSVKPKVGDNVQFTGVRIMKGNPVKGKVTKIDHESIEVKLAHELQGLTTIWYAGSTKIFSLDLINNLKVIDKKATD